MKRSRANETGPETSAEAARRLCTREGNSVSPKEDTTFFFIRLPTGKTVTADLKLSSTVDELVSYLEQKIGHINAPLSVVVGKHLAPLDETLADAGVSRDCTVQLLLTRVLSPYDYFSQEIDKVKRIFNILQQPGENRVQVVEGSLCTVISWLIPSEGGDLWPAAIRFKEIDEVATIGQHAAVLSCVLAKHPDASLDHIQTAVNSLKKLAAWAWQGLQYAAGTFDKQVADVYRDVPVPPKTFARLQCSEVLKIVETWFTAVAALVQVTLYTPKLQDQDCDSKRYLELCFAELSSAITVLVGWLTTPMPDSVQEELGERLNSITRPSRGPTRAARFPMDLSKWCGGGHATLLSLLVEADNRCLPPTAALLHGITAMLADHLLSTCQHKLMALPGLMALSPGIAVIVSWQGGDVIAAAGKSAAFAADLITVAHASLLMNPVILSFLANHRSQQSGTTAAGAGLQDISWGSGPAAMTVQSVLRTLSASARTRVLHSGARYSTVESSNLIFGGCLRACWDYSPLLLASLDQIQAFADFAAAHGVTQGARANRMPDFLRQDAAALSLMQAWLLLNDLAGDDATAGMDVDVVSFLRHSMVDKWLCAEMTREGVMAGGQEEWTVVTTTMLDLVAWRPCYAQVLPMQARDFWLRTLVFPRRVAMSTDEEDAEVEIEVRRDQLLEDSYAELLSLTPGDLRNGVRARFKGEDAVGEGVLKELLVQLAGQLFNPFAALFQPGEVDMTVMHPSTSATVQPNWQQYYRLAGRVVGLALRHRVPLGIRLSSSFFKALQSVEASIGSPKLLAVPEALLRHWMTATTFSRQTVLAAAQQQQGKEAAASALDGVSVKPLAAWRSEFKFVDRAWRAQLQLADLQLMDQQMFESLKYLSTTSGAADELHLTWSAAAAAAGLGAAETQRADCSAERAETTMLATAADEDSDADETEADAEEGVVLDAAVPPAAPSAAAAAAAPAAATASSCASGVEVELVPGGASLPVTEGNKQQYIQALIEHKLLGYCQKQVLWFYVGMCDIAEASALNLCHGRLLLPLTLQCFNAALCGSQAELDVHAWRAATLVSGRLREEPGQRTAKMFWQVVKGLNQIQLRQLLRFWIGITNLPITGFAGLGSKLQIVGINPPVDSPAAGAAAGNGPTVADLAAARAAFWADVSQSRDRTNSRANFDGNTNSSGGAADTGLTDAAAGGTAARPVLQLPRAHTCFMQLLLPMRYKDDTELREALLIALQNVDYFGRA